MMNTAEPTVVTPTTIQLTAASSLRAPIPGAWREPVAVPLPASESAASTRRAPNFVVTLSSSTEDGETIRKLMKAGIRVFRFDSRTTEREKVLKAVYAIRSISTELGRPVALLFDACLSGPAVEADQASWRFGIECGADWFAVAPGAANSELQAVRQFLADQKRAGVGILAKIEAGAAPQVVTEILPDADGAIVTMTTCDGPSLEQLDRIRSVAVPLRTARKTVVLALGKMPMGTTTPWPTLSIDPDAWLTEDAIQVSDVAQTVNQMFGALQLRPHGDQAPSNIPVDSQRDELIARAANRADESNADAIVLFTQSGRSAALCAALRPRHARVFAFTPDTRLVRRLMLLGSIEPQVLSFANQSAKTVRAAEKLLLEKGLLARGAKLVVITENLDEEQRSSAMEERTLGKP